MAVNLAEKYSDRIAEKYTHESYIKGRFSNSYDFVGVKTVKIYTPTTVEPVDYTRSGSNRYGTPVEMQDTVQELTLPYDRSFSLTVDKGNNADQMGIKAASKMLGLQMKERMIPDYDKKCFADIVAKGGTIYGSSTAISASNVAERIMDGVAALDEAEVPDGNRTIFATPTVYKFMKLCDEWIGIESLGEKSLAKGQVGEFSGMTVIRVPASKLPAGLNFLIAHKDAALCPVKLDEAKIHQDPPGINGNLLEGRQYFGAFVIGARAAGIYADINTGATGVKTICATPTQTTSGTTMTFASTTASASFKYTKDGSDPRYSTSAVAAGTATVASGDHVRAIAFKDGNYDSAVADFTVA